MSNIRGSLIALVISGLACHTEAPTALLSSLQSSEASPEFSEWSNPVNLGSVVNSTIADWDPSISKDGLSLFFAAGPRRGGFGGRDMWVSRRESTDDPWGAPQNLGPSINTSSNESNPVLSRDGHRLYFASSRPGGYGDWDLYLVRRRDKGNDFDWGPAVNLGNNVNSGASEESSVALFEDLATGRTTIYFASNRRDPTADGVGDFDIYGSTELDDGSFGGAQVIAELSTVSYRDRDPAIRRDGLEIFFASNRPGTFGGLDLWTATRTSTSEPWSAPTNLGPAINTPPRPPELEQANDWSPAISFDGTALYFASAFRTGNLSQAFDIWMTTRTKLKGQE